MRGIAGADTWQEVVIFANEREQWLRTFLEVPGGIPSHDTFERVFDRIDPVGFSAAFAVGSQPCAASCRSITWPSTASRSAVRGAVNSALCMPEVQEIVDEHFYLPFANQAAFHQMLNGARKMVDRYLGDHKQDLLRVWQTERPFALHLREGVVNGRADVILDFENGMPDRLAIVDYKTANDPKADDVFGFQLAIYAEAGRGEGLKVEAAYLHQLKESNRKEMIVDRVAGRVARNRADALIGGIVAGEFPARPTTDKCKGCDMRAICKHARCDKYDI